MSTAGSHAASGPWTLRLYERTPLPPALVGALIGLAYLAALLAFTVATDSFYGLPLAQGSPWTQPGWWSELLNAALIGLGPTILVVSLRGSQRDARELAPVLGSPARAEAAVRHATRLRTGRMRALGLATVAAALAMTYADPGLWTTRERPPLSDPFFLWMAARQVVLGWIWARAMYVDASTARAFGELAAEIRDVDLLDLRPLTPFARRGVRSVLFWMVGASLFSLFWAAPNPALTNVLTFGLFLGVAGIGLLSPLLGIRRRIRVAKLDALERIRAEIRADQAALLDGGVEAAPAAARLPALFAAESRTTAVREWPFDASTLVRFSLYATVGLGSWVGGALVEFVLGAALD